MGIRDDKGRFIKGHNFPDGGRKKLPADIMQARNMAYAEFCKTLVEIRALTAKQIKALDLDDISIGKRAMINAYASFNFQGIKIFEDRLWGKAAESVDLGLSGAVGVQLSKVEMELLADELDRIDPWVEEDSDEQDS